MKQQYRLFHIASLIFFLSGSSALIFETLWFGLTGLVVGNSVWSADIVLSGFMGGLALGNGLVFIYGHRIIRPVFFYFILEVIIGITGFSLVLVIPDLSTVLAPVFRPFLNHLWALNFLRFISVFLLILVPATAMGMTLPLMVRAICAVDRNFGSALGRLYGWNTVGAVCGTLLCEFFLLSWFGVKNSGLIATLFNLAAAGLAFRLMNLSECSEVTTPGAMPITRYFSDQVVQRLLFAACLAGGTLLAFEIIWFRFLLLKEHGTSQIFALMLAFVLAGISTGSILAARLYKSGRDLLLDSRGVALIAGILSVLTYIFFDPFYELIVKHVSNTLISFEIYAFFLITPVSFFSGILFTTLGQALNQIIIHETRAAGLLTLSNTTGGMFGALIAGFILLPVAGMEISFFILSVVYALVALAVPAPAKSTSNLTKRYIYALSLGLIVLLVTFPFGTMREVHFQKVINRWNPDKVLAIREGLASTNIYVEYQKYEKPYSYRFITDSYSMSGTNWQSRRYMELFVYLPATLNSNIRNTLLISYGVGTTARALTTVPSIESIDIVDISKDALQMSRLLYGENHPLDDPRVKVHIEDGRFYLNISNKKYDLITGEPPPPGLNKVVNLYTQDYFRIIHEHLNKGGITTYWLPVYQLPATENLSIISGFCNVFADCTLWRGAGLEWILMGSNGGIAKPDSTTFTRPWRNSLMREALRSIALEKPVQMGPLFLADADFLNRLTINIPPLTDNYPKRIGSRKINHLENASFYEMFMNEDASRDRFMHSNFINKLWPPRLKEESVTYFDFQRMFTGELLPNYRKDKHYYWDDLHTVLTSTDMEILPLVLLGSDIDEQYIVDQLLLKNDQRPEIKLAYAKRLIAERNTLAAVAILGNYLLSGNRDNQSLQLYLYTLCLAGERIKAWEIIQDYQISNPQDNTNRRFFRWLDNHFMNQSLTQK